jgi:formyltetrahydrofolate deformylase
MTTFISTLRCVDQPGIVQAASSAIVVVGGNILENDQFTDPTTGEFVMRTRFTATVASRDDVAATMARQLAAFSPTLTVRLEAQPRRALIMVSKYDHCLAELLYRKSQGDLVLDIPVVVSNHPDLEPLCASAGLPFHHVPVTPETKDLAEQELRTLIAAHDIDFVVLARYMQVLSATFCEDFAGRVVNIHHSFLPGFKGARPYHQAHARGVKLIGATAHFVTGDLDEGPIIDQDVVRVTHARTVDDFVALGRDVERTVLARAVGLLAQDRVALVGQRTVIFSQ